MPRIQGARDWDFVLLEPTIYQVTYYLLNLYYSCYWNKTVFRVYHWHLSNHSCFRLQINVNLQSKNAPNPKKRLLSLGLVALIYFPFLLPASTFPHLRFLVMSLIRCANLGKSLNLSEFQFSAEKNEGNSAGFTELSWESNKLFLCESTLMKDMECVNTPHLWGYSLKCVGALSPVLHQDTPNEPHL